MIEARGDEIGRVGEQKDVQRKREELPGKESVVRAERGGDLNAASGTITARTAGAGTMTARTEFLKGIVGDFAKQAVQGNSCTHFNDKSGRRTDVTYKISQDLEWFTIEARKRGLLGRFSVKFPIVAVRDIDSFEAVEELIKPTALATLTTDDRDRLVMVFYDNGKGDNVSVTLLMESRQSRHFFANGLKTLASSLQT